MPLPTRPFSVLVVDDHPLIQNAMSQLISSDPEFCVVAKAGNRAQALELTTLHQPALILLDIVLPDGNGLDLIGALRSFAPQTKIVVVTALRAEAFAYRSAAAGASGFISKDDPDTEVLRVLRKVVGHGSIYESSFPEMDHSFLKGLTERELSVFQLLGRGRTTRDIAATLGISIKTVESHRENIKTKLGLPHSLALMQRATLWANQN